jgi:hypothetical protein
VRLLIAMDNSSHAGAGSGSGTSSLTAPAGPSASAAHAAPSLPPTLPPPPPDLGARVVPSAGETATEHPDASLTVVRCAAYRKHIAGGPGPATAYLGRRAALIIDGGSGLDDLCSTSSPASSPPPSSHDYRATLAAVALVVRTLEDVLAAFDKAVGRVPPNLCPFHGRVRLEVAFLPNAAGLAHHGQAGVAVGPAFVRGMVDAAKQGKAMIDHVFCYELMRNYIFPEDFTRVLDYCLPSSPDCWGWVNQGFVDIFGTLLVPRGVDFNYYGKDRARFMTDMATQLARYRFDASLSWDDVFLRERLPWDGASSLDNVYAGILAELYHAHGGVAFLRGFFRALPLLVQRAPASKTDVKTARDNFFLASCIGAGKDLREWFEVFLRWPVSEDAKAVVEALLVCAAAEPA